MMIIIIMETSFHFQNLLHTIINPLSLGSLQLVDTIVIDVNINVIKIIKIIIIIIIIIINNNNNNNRYNLHLMIVG